VRGGCWGRRHGGRPCFVVTPASQDGMGDVEEQLLGQAGISGLNSKFIRWRLPHDGSPLRSTCGACAASTARRACWPGRRHRWPPPGGSAQPPWRLRRGHSRAKQADGGGWRGSNPLRRGGGKPPMPLMGPAGLHLPEAARPRRPASPTKDPRSIQAMPWGGVAANRIMGAWAFPRPRRFVWGCAPASAKHH